MNKQQEKLYKEYEADCKERNEEPMSREDFLKELLASEEQEKKEYLDYQKKMSDNNSKIPEGKEPEKVLTKEEWIKKGKPTGETKNEKFQRLAEVRTNKVIDAIEKMHPLTMPAYASTPEERKQIIEAIKQAIKKLEDNFMGQKTLSNGFKFKPAEPVASPV